MPNEPSAFYTDIMQEVTARATARGEFTRTALFENLTARLIEAEELQDCTPCFYEGKGYRGRSLGLDGYSDDDLELDNTLRLLILDYREGPEVQALTTRDVTAAFDRVAAFVADARAGRLLELEPSTPAADLARLLHDLRDSIRTLRVLVLSNATLGMRYREIKRPAIDSLKVELHVWDLGRFHQLAGVGGREELDLDVTAFAPQGLPALPAGIGNANYQAFLCVVPGSLLADLYDQYGSRLLEANVRAFLSAKGNVNKGIRKTIATAPERFFAFNNGITATATSADLNPQGNIVRIRDLQIVNGGQTTASLYSAHVRDQAPLDAIFVQMKLSVLSPEVAQQMIPDISRFANTQNKVSDADLFANHPFHRRVEEISRQVWAPAQDGSNQMTHWFYERARAQYQTESLRLTASEKKAFLLQNPKAQVITKTDLGKYENTWRQLPHVVSFGAQKNFAKYAEAIREEYDRGPATFNERWFQHLVAKAILFSSTERIVSTSTWYANAYRANIVTYAIAKLVEIIKAVFPGRVLDLDRIWKAQGLLSSTVAQLALTAEAAYRVLISPPVEGANVTEWAKRELCWDKVRKAPVGIVRDLARELKAADEERLDRRDAREQSREDDVISAQVKVVQLAKSGFWNRAIVWPATQRILSAVEIGILRTAVQRGAGWVPSDGQAKRLVSAARRLADEGLE